MPRKFEETKFKEKVQRALREIPDLYCVKIQQVALRGVPDLLICYRGHFHAWELKTDKGKVEDLQAFVIEKINKAGGRARVVTPTTFKQALEELLNGTKDDQSK